MPWHDPSRFSQDTSTGWLRTCECCSLTLNCRVIQLPIVASIIPVSMCVSVLLFCQSSLVHFGQNGPNSSQTLVPPSSSRSAPKVAQTHLKSSVLEVCKLGGVWTMYGHGARMNRHLNCVLGQTAQTAISTTISTSNTGPFSTPSSAKPPQCPHLEGV